MNFTAPYYLNSKDRQSGEPLNDFTIAYTSNAQGLTNIAVKSIQITNNMYPIILGENSQIDYNDGVNTGYCVLPSGNYSATDLATAIADRMSSAMIVSGGSPGPSALTFTCTYNSLTSKLTIASSSNFTLYTLRSSGTDSMFDAMGYDRLANKSGFNSYTAEYPVNIKYTSYIDVCSRALTKCQPPSQSSDYRRADVICRIPLNSFRFGEEVFYEIQNLRMIRWVPSEVIGNIDISVYDDSGNLHPEMNNSEFNLVINMYAAR